MTVAPKYADLPWIATDGTDVYETEDLPEVDQDSFKIEENSITNIKINLEEAKKVFNSKLINAEDVDFSDRIRPYVNTGYSIERNEYTLYPETEKQNESVLDRFQRLQHEVRDFVNEIEQIKSSSIDVSESKCKSDELLKIGKELELMSNNLTSYKMHCSLGPEEALNVEIDEELCGFDQKEMFEEIQKYVSSYKKDNRNQGNLVWEKYYRSPLNKEMNKAKIASIDQRIQRIEAAIGYGEHCSNFSTLNSETATKSLMEAVKILTSRCQPLKGGPNLDKIEIRLVDLLSKLQTITEKRDLITEADRQNKIADLFNLVQKWQQFQLVLPVILKRLEELQDLHNQAMLFADSIGHMDKIQKEMKKDMASYQEILTKVQMTLAENVQNIKVSIESIQEKVNRVAI